ncbi:MAG: hypothetical protein OES57_16385 [Acidimicrobiia bacterium]|nr:hypothetical protein [Acidimicrobiia bacterium]
MTADEWAEAQRIFQARVVLGDLERTAAPVLVFSHRRWTTITRGGLPFTSIVLVTILAILPPVSIGLLVYDRSGVFIAGAALLAVLAVELVLLVNVGWWGRRTFGYLDAEPEASVVALYRHPPIPTEPPAVVAEVHPDDAERLPLDGTVVVVGDVEPGGRFGIADGDYMIWPVAPPRSPVWPEPSWGEEADWR